MPIRFSTKAANADVLGEDPDTAEAPETLPENGTPRASSRRPASSRPSKGHAKADEAKPGKDINAAGFVRDKEAGKP